MCIARLLHNAASPQVHRFCHQLDYATSGILVLAKSLPAASAASKLFANRTTRKEYQALVYGWPEWQETHVATAIDAHSAGGFR